MTESAQRKLREAFFGPRGPGYLNVVMPPDAAHKLAGWPKKLIRLNPKVKVRQGQARKRYIQRRVEVLNRPRFSKTLYGFPVVIE